MRRIGWPKKPGTTNDIHARGMMYGTDGTPWSSESNPLRATHKGPASKRVDLKEPWGSDPEMRTTWHIEGNAVAWMIHNRQIEAVLYINQTVCGKQEPRNPKRCFDNLPKIMPQNTTLYVHSVLESGWVQIKKFEGTGEAIK